MQHGKLIFRKLLFPTKWVRLVVPPLSFAALVCLLVSQRTENPRAYGIYCLSACSLAIWCAAAPAFLRRLRRTFHSSRAVRRLTQTEFGGKYLNDLAFRGNISIYQGMVINSYNIVTVIGTAASRVYFHLKAEAVRMGE